MSDSYLKQLLADKLPHSSEIELHLFEFCNLSCAFCGQDHDDTTGMSEESIVDKAYQVIEFMENSDCQHHTVNLMGGEIFNDDVPDSMFEAYRKFNEIVSEWVKENDQTVRFNWVTNLVLHQSDRVEWLLDNTYNSYISTSYDFAGRGMTNSRQDPFKQNLLRFGDRITVIGFVMSKPAIKAIMKQIDPFFDYLYENYTLYFDYYVPELAADKMMPSDEQLRDVLLYLARNYPKVYPVRDLLEKENNEMTCFSLNKTTILPDGEQVTCRYMHYDEGDFLNEVDYKSNENIIEAHMEREGCLACPWFDRCSLRCFVQADWSRLQRMDDCPIRSFFEIADSEKRLYHTSDRA